MTSGVLSNLWVALGTHLWQTTLVLAGLFIAARTLRRAPAGLLNSLFWIGLAKLLIPLPLLKHFLGGAVDAAVRTVSSAGPVVKATTPLIEGSAAVLDPAGIFPGIGEQLGSVLPAALTVVWASGALLLAFLWLRSTRSRVAVPARSMLEAPLMQRRRLADALLGTGVPESVVFVTESSVVPHVAGVLRPRIVVPKRLVEEISSAALGSILLHEDAHRKRREPLRLLVSRVAAVVFFFYPLLWPLLKRLKETGEMACDDAVLAGGIRPGVYTRALASVINLELTAAPSSAALDRRSPSLMRRRLMRLNEPRRCTMQFRHRAALSIAVVCVLMASVLSLSSVAGDPSTDSKAPVPPDKPDPPAVESPAPLPEMLDIHVSKMVPPEYPEEPRAKGLEAIVFVEITLAPDLTVAAVEEKTVIVGYPPLEIIKVGKDGKVVEPVEEEGMDAYHEIFVKAATDAALQWQLEVSPEGVSTEEISVVVPIQFRLDGEEEKETEKS